MDKIPRISVLVPVFNTAKYLSACLDSVLSQSMPDFEIIAVNDASTDNSLDILTAYAAKDARIRIENHEKNKGLLAARTTAIKAAAGKYTLFLDSDDAFRPGILQAVFDLAEKSGADIIDFSVEVRLHSESGREKTVRHIHPGKQVLLGEDVFRKYFVEHAYRWTIFQKLFRAEVCRKAAEYIPDKFCLMAEDFCLASLCSFFARHYCPLQKYGYIYYTDSGISGFQKTELGRYLNRQSPFQALRNVRDFLQKQNVWEKYREAFADMEQNILQEYVLRWMRNLPDADRMKAFNGMFRGYDAFPLFQAFRNFFSDKNELFLEMLSGEDPDSARNPGKMERTAENLSLQNSRMSTSRWNELQELVRKNLYDAVILEPDDDPERLFWDILAVRDAGAAAVCRRTRNYLDILNRKGLNAWLMEDRALRQAGVILASDEESAQWFRKRNCHAGTSPETIGPPQYSEQTSAAMLALGNCERQNAYYRIDPSDDGETFVPFFRKLDHLFRKLPAGFRKRLFGKLADFYNRITGN